MSHLLEPRGMVVEDGFQWLNDNARNGLNQEGHNHHVVHLLTHIRLPALSNPK